MASPAKRRKKNDNASSPNTVRSLDHFFGKQTREKQDALHNGVVESTGNESVPESNTDAIVARTDEELARRLQEQWDREERELNGSDLKTASQDETGTFEDQNANGAVAQNPPPDLRQQREDPPASSEQHTDWSNEAVAKSAAPKTLSLQSAASAEDTSTATIPFDENPLTFEPSKYIPNLQKHWASQGGDACYALLTRCFVLVNSTQSRIKIVDNLVNLLRLVIEADAESLLPAVWLATNSIGPPYVTLELGLGGSAISKALKKVCGLDSQGLKTLYNKHGDAGDVAFEAKKRQSFTLRKPKPLSIKNVYQSLVKIAHSKGNGSQEFKQRIVERLVQDARGAEESRYIVRTLVQHLRIGAVKTTMLIALSRAFLLSKPRDADFSTHSKSELASFQKERLAEIYSKAEEIVKACYARRPNYNDLIPALLEVGVSQELLLRCNLTLHIPLRPMLGGITRDLSEMLTKLQGRDFSCEFKYDGQRAQVHCDARGKVSIFSRHLELMTDKYPDLVALVPEIRGEGVESFIMEGEVVAIDRDTGQLKPFQTLAGRGRKDVDLGNVKVDVCLYAFDLMYLNGEELLDRPFRERRGLMRSLFVEVPHQFTWVNSIDATSADSEAVLEFFKSATDIKCEGIMVKVLDNLTSSANDLGPSDESAAVQKPSLQVQGTPSKKRKKAKLSSNDPSAEKEKGTRRKALLATYEPDKRLDSWLKVKKDYDTTFDTLDLIPVAGWHGQGRKAKWWSPILLASRNPETGSLEAVCKCISGFTDKFYAENKVKYAEDSDNVLGERPSYVDYTGNPDAWFEPQEVWEMAFADVTISPTYTAAIGLVSDERGLSLRFPRFLKRREDKGIDEASTSDFLAALWKKQTAKAPAAVKEDGDADLLCDGNEEDDDGG
ncbi:MAG: hypothetical protein M1837_005170 [Sclerophora amabilis]|nr:MAG: hypothetical protein M1837_005170 [Sclerophora amabilis]